MRLRHLGPALALLLVAPAAGLFDSTPSQASVSIAVTWDALLQRSSSVVIATPFEARSAWENGRIYTYTHLHVDRALAGDLGEGAEPWVRTLGGAVGDIGQAVEGEAVLSSGQASFLFLHPVASSFEVTARAQGQFPVVKEADPAKPAHLVRNGAAGLLIPRRGDAPLRLAGEVLHGLSVDDAGREVSSAWARTHAR